jgi:hypothetical protein
LFQENTMTRPNNREVEQLLADAWRELQQARTALAPAALGFGDNSLGPAEVTLLLRRLHNAVAQLVDAVDFLNGNRTRRPF